MLLYCPLPKRSHPFPLLKPLLLAKSHYTYRAKFKMKWGIKMLLYCPLPKRGHLSYKAPLTKSCYSYQANFKMKWGIKMLLYCPLPKRGHLSYKAPLTKSCYSYQANFKMKWGRKMLLIIVLKRGHTSYKITFSLQRECPYIRVTTVMIIFLCYCSIIFLNICAFLYYANLTYS